MANYSSLLAAVNAAITANGTGAITGPVLNTVLQQMIVSLGQGGYIFKGRAIPTTDPGSPDQNVFYIATTPGTYTNFSSIVVAAGECAILKGSGTGWSKEATGIDLVSVSQNISTGHTDINIGSDSYPVASVEEVNQLGQIIEGNNNQFFQKLAGGQFEFTQVPQENLILLGGAYLNRDAGRLILPFGYGNLYYYPVQAGKIYRVSSNCDWYDVYDAIGFMEDVPTINGTYNESIISAKPPVLSKYYMPSKDGYILLSCPAGYSTYLYTFSSYKDLNISQDYETGSTTISIGSNSYNVATNPVSVTENAETGHTDISVGGTTTPVASVNEVQDLQHIIEGENNEIFQDLARTCFEYTQVSQNDLTFLGNAYLKRDSDRLISPYSDSSLYYYPVQAGNIYKLSSECDWFEVYDAIGFVRNVPTINGTYDESIIPAKPPVLEKYYMPSEDGYILLSFPVGYRTFIFNCSGVKDLRFFEEHLFPLKDKTIAVLGDSIMEFMGGEVPYSNVITLKNLSDPTDTTIYQISDSTIVNGIIYLTSSLNNGEVTSNSIRLEIVNSEQAYIDSRGWEQLKTHTMAKAVINCGQGGGTYPEMGIATHYPSTTLSGAFGDKLQSFPNQVRMLIRMVNDGLYDTPDCIVIWMGINGTTLLINDTLNEAMQIDWDILSDDVAGYTYRTKFFAAIRYGIEMLYRTFPDTTIIFVSPVMTNRGDRNITGEWNAYRGYGNIKEVSDAVKSIAERYSCMFFSALTEIGVANFAFKADTTLDSGEQIATGTPLGNLIPRFTADGLHPSSLGKIRWGNYLANKLNHNFYNIV